MILYVHACPLKLELRDTRHTSHLDQASGQYQVSVFVPLTPRRRWTPSGQSDASTQERATEVTEVRLCRRRGVSGERHVSHDEGAEYEWMKMTAEMSSVPVLSRRRVRRVLYPAGARRVLPKEDRDPMRRWLLLLSAVLFLQIYTEDERWDGPSAEGAAGQGDVLTERHRDMPEGDTPQSCGLNLHMQTQQPKCSQ
ncbi:hypothetical protein QTP70_013711 [Hemibagrus guttatus]|uniref:Radiation-inducible immediate-early gene IEX-1 n=1 Tax=Hemibagrus guttatus TaxID=175788 RepID=A0AAE0Q5Y9_9TELE|nr:hypothetical protein QTP70_013711 [Hemibagrus guttatus]